jgi:hypothetical protein
MEEPKYLKLQWSESVIVVAASQIFAAYVSAGRVNDSNEEQMLLKSIRTAIKLADKADTLVKSDDEGQG